MRQPSRRRPSEASTTLYDNSSPHRRIISYNRPEHTRGFNIEGGSAERNSESSRYFRPRIHESMVRSSRRSSSSGRLASVTANCSHYKSASRGHSDTTRNILSYDPQYSIPKKITSELSSSILCPILLEQTSITYDFIEDCRIVLEKELLSMPVFRSPYRGQIKKILIIFQEWDWKVEIMPSVYWGGDVITIGDVLDTIYLHLNQPIRQVTWNNTSTERKRIAKMRCRERGDRTKRRIDWLGGTSAFGNLKFFGHSVGEYTAEGGVWLISFAPGRTVLPA
ncbi:hypothetical protein FRC16_002324 [Serendipita sp. 398]|nr:hypothetical protein FRC16_002324 [Serendipita sp. 398]